jgi:cyclophilin family peptidyl-prolyl cis-trans isomerase
MTSVHRTVVAAFVLALIVASCGGGDSDAAPSTTGIGTTAPGASTTTVAEIPLESTRPPVNYEEFRTQPTACGAGQPPPLTPETFPAPEDLALDPTSRPLATVATSCGEIVVELDPSIAPATVNSFVFLAERGYFEGTAIHRVVPGFVVQAGDPDASGRGGPGYAVPDEFAPADYVYAAGIVAMANAGPGTSGSQFFVVLEDVQFPAQYRFNVFGRVVDGFDTLERIAALPLGAGPTGEVSVPLETVYIERVAVVR